MNNLVPAGLSMLTGILIVLLCTPLALRKVPMNRLYGVRFPKSFVSDECWYRINAYGGTLLIKWSPVYFCAGIIFLFLPEMGLAGMWGVAGLVLLLGIPLFQIYRFVQSLD